MALLLFAAPAAADDVLPAIDWQRITVGAGANYVGRFDAGDEPLPEPDHEWELGLYGAYTLVPRLALVASAERGFDTKRWELGPGINLRLTERGAPVSFGLKAAYRIYSAEGDVLPPTFGKEWIVALNAGRALTDWLVLAASCDYALDNQQFKLAGGLRVAHAFARGGF
jgi:hypothetical protein